MCSNSRCKSIFLLNSKELKKETDIFCPNCKEKLASSSVVQCKNCQSIIKLVPYDLEDEPVTFTVEKCSHCSGTIEDEWEITSSVFPDSFI